MSHTTTLKNLAIRDVDALYDAAARLRNKGINCEMVQNARPRMYYGEQGDVCEHVLKLNDGNYDVGFKLQEDGTYSPVLDTYANHVGNQIGANVEVCPMPSSPEGRAQHAMGQFMQEYALAVAQREAAAQGFSVESETLDAEGNVHLVVTA